MTTLLPKVLPKVLGKVAPKTGDVFADDVASLLFDVLPGDALAPVPYLTLALGTSAVALAQGATATVPVTIQRFGVAGAPAVTLAGLPVGVTASALTIAAGATTGTLTLTAASDATVGAASVTATAAIAGATSGTASFGLTVTATGTPGVLTLTVVTAPSELLAPEASAPSNVLVSDTILRFDELRVARPLSNVIPIPDLTVHEDDVSKLALFLNGVEVPCAITALPARHRPAARGGPRVYVKGVKVHTPASTTGTWHLVKRTTVRDAAYTITEPTVAATRAALPTYPKWQIATDGTSFELLQDQFSSWLNTGNAGDRFMRAPAGVLSWRNSSGGAQPGVFVAPAKKADGTTADPTNLRYVWTIDTDGLQRVWENPSPDGLSSATAKRGAFFEVYIKLAPGASFTPGVTPLASVEVHELFVHVPLVPLVLAYPLASTTYRLTPLLGRVTNASLSGVEAAWATADTTHLTNLDTLQQAYGVTTAGTAQYSRGRTWYHRYQRDGTARSLYRALATATSFVAGYAEDNVAINTAYGASYAYYNPYPGFWSNAQDIYLGHFLTGHPFWQTAIDRQSFISMDFTRRYFGLSSGSYGQALGGTSGEDRERARSLACYLARLHMGSGATVHYYPGTGATAPGSSSTQQFTIAQAVSDVLSTQRTATTKLPTRLDASGTAYDENGAFGGYNYEEKPTPTGRDRRIGTKNYMMLMILNELVDYYEQVDADPVVAAAIILGANWVWRTQYVSGVQQFQYISCSYATGDSSGGGTDPQGGINGLFLPAFAFARRYDDVANQATWNARLTAIITGTPTATAGIDYRELDERAWGFQIAAAARLGA